MSEFETTDQCGITRMNAVEMGEVFNAERVIKFEMGAELRECRLGGVGGTR